MLAQAKYPDAALLKSEIETALNLYSADSKAEAGVYVQGSDSNNSHPIAWFTFQYLHESDLPKLKSIGWKLVQGWSEKRRIKLMLSYEGPEA